jgi:hypothetical protein
VHGINIIGTEYGKGDLHDKWFQSSCQVHDSTFSFL